MSGPVAYSPDTGGDGFYQMGLNNIRVNGTAVKGTQAQTAILDSGTNVLLLPTGAYDDMKSVFLAACGEDGAGPHGICDVDKSATLFDSQCFEMSEAQMAAFPPLSIELGGGVTLDMHAEDYLLLDAPGHDGDGLRCLGVRPTSSGPGALLIIGDTTMRNYYVVYDRRAGHKQIGWAPVNKKNCGSI